MIDHRALAIIVFTVSMLVIVSAFVFVSVPALISASLLSSVRSSVPLFVLVSTTSSALALIPVLVSGLLILCVSDFSMNQEQLPHG